MRWQGELLQEGAVGRVDAPTRAPHRLFGIGAAEEVSVTAGDEAGLPVVVLARLGDQDVLHPGGEVVDVELVVVRAVEDHVGGTAAAAAHLLGHGEHEFLDGDLAVAVVVGGFARGGDGSVQGDLRRGAQLGGIDPMVAVAVGHAGQCRRARSAATARPPAIRAPSFNPLSRIARPPKIRALNMCRLDAGFQARGLMRGTPPLP